MNQYSVIKLNLKKLFDNIAFHNGKDMFII